MSLLRQSRREWLLRLMLVAGSLVVSLLLFEAILRLWAPGDNLRVTATADFFRPDDTRGFALQANLERAIYWHGQRVEIITNAAGRRVPGDPSFVEIRDRRQLLLIGDSYVFGMEENADDSFVNLLREHSNYDAINLGTPAYGTRMELDSLQEFVESEGHSLVDFALLFFFVGNDFTDNILPMSFYSTDENGRILRDGKNDRLLMRKLVYSSHALSFLYLRIKPLINQLKYRNAGASTARAYSPSFYTTEVMEANREALSSFRDYVDSLGIPFGVVVIPHKDQLYKNFDSEADRLRPNRMAIDLLQELSIPYLDLLPHFERRRSESIYNMIPTGHFSVNGHKIVAELVMDFVNQSGSRVSADSAGTSEEF